MRAVLDAGHGGRDPGATYRDHREKDLVLPVTRDLGELLTHAFGWDVFYTRTRDCFPTLRERVDFVNRIAPDILVSIHMNADRDEDGDGMPEAQGEEVWFWKDEDQELAEHLAIGMKRVYPTEPFRGVKKGKLYILRKVACPAALVELGFIDHSETARRMSERLEQEEAALALALGLLRRQQLIEQGTVYE